VSLRYRSPGRLLCVLALVVAITTSAGCAGDAGVPSVSPDDAARLTSVLAGSDRVLPAEDVTAANVIGLDLVTLVGPLTVWWDDLNDPAITEAEWLARAPDRLASMTRTVEHMAAQLGPERAPAVRTTYQPYVDRWRSILDALAALRDAVARRDPVAQQRATDDYNLHRAALARFDRIRVDRVVEVYGRAEAARALEAQGLDPSRYGL
jgi:hypothetical protein